MRYEIAAKRYHVRVPLGFCNPQLLKAMTDPQKHVARVLGKYSLLSEGLETLDGKPVEGQEVNITVPLPLDAILKSSEIITEVGPAGVTWIMKRADETEFAPTTVTFAHYSERALVVGPVEEKKE